MRKIIAVSLMVFYLVLSIGVSINAHFCGGNLKSVSVSSEGGKCCCDSGEKSNNCCSDKNFFVQYDNDAKQISSFRLELGKFQVAINDWVKQDTTVAQSCPNNHYGHQKAPPPKQALWLRHCSLTYYG